MKSLGETKRSAPFETTQNSKFPGVLGRLFCGVPEFCRTSAVVGDAGREIEKRGSTPSREKRAKIQDRSGPLVSALGAPL